ncbi:MAG TPA: translation elongation factor Ts [Candidatus Dormibacteraeota bacterium]|jgi:elongation factor Ts|nr:translation elongation factor Ts [Candidatus Dormibacteraeota bacterium]
MAISAEQVKALRDATGAGMMDSKRALEATNGDIEKAKDWLRQKGMAKAGAKAARTAKEGIIATYIHHNHQLGVMVELNSESDFVARNDEFRHLAHEIAVHIAAAEPRYVRREEVPEEVLNREKAIFEAQAADQKKPPQVVEKIVQGKLNDFYKREVLIDQPWAKDDKRTVDQVLKEGIAKLGENITISRFARFKVGEAS